MLVDLSCHALSLMNSFQIGQGPCHANLHKWCVAQSPSCDCGQRQTMNHIVDTCLSTRIEGGLNSTKRMMTQSYGWNLQRLQHSEITVITVVVLSVGGRQFPPRHGRVPFLPPLVLTPFLFLIFSLPSPPLKSS